MGAMTFAAKLQAWRSPEMRSEFCQRQNSQLKKLHGCNFLSAHSAVYAENLGGDVGAQVAGEKQCGVCNVFGFSGAL